MLGLLRLLVFLINITPDVFKYSTDLPQYILFPDDTNLSLKYLKSLSIYPALLIQRVIPNTAYVLDADSAPKGNSRVFFHCSYTYAHG